MLGTIEEMEKSICDGSACALHVHSGNVGNGCPDRHGQRKDNCQSQQQREDTFHIITPLLIGNALGFYCHH